MLCHGKPKKSVWSKCQIGGAQLYDEAYIPWKFHEFQLSGSRGVGDTRCVPPFDIQKKMYIAKSMLCHGKPKKSVWSKNRD